MNEAEIKARYNIVLDLWKMWHGYLGKPLTDDLFANMKKDIEKFAGKNEEYRRIAIDLGVAMYRDFEQQYERSENNGR